MSIPAGASDVAFFEADAWEEDSLYVPFAATPAGLTGFPARLRTNRARRPGLPAQPRQPADRGRRPCFYTM